MAGDEDAPFSRRMGYVTPAEITVREDAPEALRYALLREAEGLGLDPHLFRGVVCDIMRRRPDKDNWSAYPNVWDEVQGLVYGCPWPEVYEIMEAVHARLSEADIEKKGAAGGKFEVAINAVMVEEGIGWQLRKGKVEAREPEPVEQVLQEAERVLDEASLENALRELRLARQALSARSIPDLTGAVSHISSALESAARRYSATRETLGTLIENRHAELGIRPPLHSAISKMYGFASEVARHGAEDPVALTRDEVDMAIGVYASVLTFLVARHGATA
ncbi:MAG: AbiJ-NTD4 domain-containing protein [Thermoplasmatota archaeon]